MPVFPISPIPDWRAQTAPTTPVLYLCHVLLASRHCSAIHSRTMQFQREGILYRNPPSLMQKSQMTEKYRSESAYRHIGQVYRCFCNSLPLMWCPIRKFTAALNTGDSRGILPYSVMYGAIQMLVRYERFGEILHEDCMFMDAVRRFHAPIRQGASIFVRKNTQKYLQKPLIRSLNGIYWRYSEFSDRH